LKSLVNKYKQQLSAFLDENGRGVNFLLVLGITTFIIVWIDLNSELAVEKNEIEYVVAVLAKSINTLNIDTLNFLIVDPPVESVVLLYNDDYSTTDVLRNPTGRSPPL